MKITIIICVVTVAICNVTLGNNIDGSYENKLQNNVGLDNPSIDDELNSYRKDHNSEKYRKEMNLRDMIKTEEENNKLMYDGRISFNKQEPNNSDRIMQKSISSLAELWNGMMNYLVNNGTGAYIRVPATRVILPKEFDWREKGFDNPVRDQGNCGASWAFSAVGAIEGQYFRKTGRLMLLSVQNLIDCTLSYGNRGCQGGFPERAYRYVRDNNGIESELNYPYQSRDDLRCQYKNEEADISLEDNRFSWLTFSEKSINLAELQVKSYRRIHNFDDLTLMYVVVHSGPVSVSVYSNSDSFQSYTGGVYCEPMPPREDPKLHLHQMLLIGFGTEDNGGDYWLIKNSWGTKWGEEGYLKLSRSPNCGHSLYGAGFPIV